MNHPQDRVQVWASQLAANDFPPVCAVTGAPVETWRKFRFSTPPPWAYAFLGLIALGPLVSIRAKVTMQPGYYDKLVELRNVHPAFVAAVNQMHQARMAQQAAMQPPANIPLPPESK